MPFTTRPANDPVKVILRTYSLALSLSLAPALLPLLTSPKARSTLRLRETLRRELGPKGFAFAVAIAVGGGSLLDHFLTTNTQNTNNNYPNRLYHRLRRLSGYHRTLIANLLSSSLAAILLTSNRHSQHIPTASIPYTVPAPLSRGSPTLDLTLLLLVRTLDGYLQSYLQSDEANAHNKMDEFKSLTKKHIISKTAANLDIIIFWLACSRIMWCFFYEPDRLPKSYVKWITSLADMDSRLITVLQAIREGNWKYGEPSFGHGDLLQNMAKDLKLSPALGDPARLPAYGGPEADRIWGTLGTKGRRGVGGVPCDLVHCGIGGNSCTLNAVFRGIRAFGQALLIYAPVHVLPPLLSNPARLISDPLPVLRALFRSATFLSSFISSIWFTVCCVRTLCAARLFPHISHNFWDGPQGCILAGCLACGASIGIERGNRRGEIALYVLPRAIRACLPNKWVKSGSWTCRNIERMVFVWSLASMLTMAVHQPQVLRGLSRWTLGYVMEGRPRSPKKKQIGFQGEHSKVNANENNQ